MVSSVRPVVEACVTSLEEARTAAAAGADRVELCLDLEVGGRSPSFDLVRRVQKAIEIPVFEMVRGPLEWVLTPAQKSALVQEVARRRAAGAHGVVMGALNKAGRVDARLAEEVVAAAGDCPVTFHRAFDESVDLLGDFDALTRAGVARILTGGGPGRAIDSVAVVRELIERAGPTEILVAGGVRADHILELVESTGAREVHARASAIPDLIAELA